MPWCEPCARFFNPATLTADGDCPTCGKHLARPAAMGRAGGGGRDDRAGRVGGTRRRARTPWHFWLLVGMAGLYLGWRLVQGVVWVVGLF